MSQVILDNKTQKKIKDDVEDLIVQNHFDWHDLTDCLVISGGLHLAKLSRGES